jgi:Uma2 family endonuclease
MCMSAGTQISVAECLATSFPDGDREYVDGEVLERNMGEIEHGNLQGRLYLYLMTHYTGIWAAPETRVQVRPSRFRVPDVVVVAGRMPSGRVITEPPLLAIEVLSRDDRADEVQEKRTGREPAASDGTRTCDEATRVAVRCARVPQRKIDDYLNFGVRFVWVVNPRTRQGYVHTAEGSRPARDGILRTSDPALEVPLAELFESL